MPKVHHEAYQLMEFKCAKCTIEESIWNSSNQDAPNIVDCVICGHDVSVHQVEKDKYQPCYITRVGERVFIDGEIKIVNDQLQKELEKQSQERKKDSVDFTQAISSNIPNSYLEKMQEIQEGLLDNRVPSEAMTYLLKGEGMHNASGWLKENGYESVHVRRMSHLLCVVTLNKKTIAHYVKFTCIGGGGIIYEAPSEGGELDN